MDKHSGVKRKHETALNEKAIGVQTRSSRTRRHGNVQSNVSFDTNNQRDQRTNNENNSSASTPTKNKQQRNLKSQAYQKKASNHRCQQRAKKRQQKCEPTNSQNMLTKKPDNDLLAVADDEHSDDGETHPHEYWLNDPANRHKSPTGRPVGGSYLYH